MTLKIGRHDAAAEIQSAPALKPTAALMAKAAAAGLQARTGAAARADFEELKARVIGAIHDHGSKQPEADETWEEWHAAAFDLLGDAVGRIFDAAAASGARDELAEFEAWFQSIHASSLDGKLAIAWRHIAWAAWEARAARSNL